MSEIAKKIDEVIKLSLVPLLRSKGFKKKGRNFLKPLWLLRVKG